MEIVRVGSVASTQELALSHPIGTLVVADHQEAGRGRLGRRWEAPPGTALLASFVMPFHALAPLAAGVAAAEACGPQVRLKWPNDLLLEDRKLGGILVEASGERCVVGIGINLSWAPPGAARLKAEREVLLARLVSELERWWVVAAVEVLDAWRARSDTLGRRVRVELGAETFEGIAEEIADDGSLVVGGRTVAAADVTHLRVAQPSPAAPEGPPPTSPG
jgi:BirA family transcriptional regulator, biotin operon repressor / biotin---[acetyl-CoA-carboxylase] ligase